MERKSRNYCIKRRLKYINKSNRRNKKNKQLNHKNHKQIKNKIKRKLKNQMKITNKRNMMISKLNKQNKLDLKLVVIRDEERFKKLIKERKKKIIN